MRRTSRILTVASLGIAIAGTTVAVARAATGPEPAGPHLAGTWTPLPGLALKLCGARTRLDRAAATGAGPAVPVELHSCLAVWNDGTVQPVAVLTNYGDAAVTVAVTTRVQAMAAPGSGDTAVNGCPAVTLEPGAGYCLGRRERFAGAPLLSASTGALSGRASQTATSATMTGHDVSAGTAPSAPAPSASGTSASGTSAGARPAGWYAALPFPLAGCGPAQVIATGRAPDGSAATLTVRTCVDAATDGRIQPVVTFTNGTDTPAAVHAATFLVEAHETASPSAGAPTVSAVGHPSLTCRQTVAPQGTGYCVGDTFTPFRPGTHDGWAYAVGTAGILDPAHDFWSVSGTTTGWPPAALVPAAAPS